MTKQLLLLITAAAAMQLSAGAGIASDAAKPDAIPSVSSIDRESVLALFISALLEKSPETRCAKLLEVIEKDLPNAEAPLHAFRTSFKKLQKPSTLLKKFNALWEKHPSDPLLTLHGIALNSACGVPLRELLPRMRVVMTPQKFTNLSFWNSAATFSLLRHAAGALLDSSQYEKLPELFKEWQKMPLPHSTAAAIVLAEACYTGAARAWAAGKDKIGTSLDECFTEILSSVKKTEQAISDRRVAENILYLYLKFRPVMPGEALRFIREYDGRTKSLESNLWKLTAAVECGSIEDFNKALALVSELNPHFDAAELRFKLLVNAGKFSEAKKALKRLPQKKHFDLLILLYVKQKAWKELHSLITQALQAGTPPDYKIGHLLVSMAEKNGDTAMFRMGEKMLMPYIKNPAIANAVGYVSAVLDLDLPRARKLLTYALKKEPGNMAYLDSMAWIAFKQKRYDEAEKFINAALEEITPSDGIAVAMEHAGDIAAARGKSPLRFYRLSLKYAPFDTELDRESVIKKMKAFK